MSISVQCVKCQYKLRAQDDLAGKRVKCPNCGTVVIVPATQSIAEVSIDSNSLEGLYQAIEAEEPEQIVSCLGRPFTLIKTADCPEDEFIPLTAEIEETPVVVAFSSNDAATRFAEATAGEFGPVDGSLNGFVLSGLDLIQGIPAEFGLLLDPENEDARFLTSDLVAALRPLAERESKKHQQANEIRQGNVRLLHQMGFSPADSLPLPDMSQKLRPTSEIAARLLGLAGIFCWATAPEEAVSTETIKRVLQRKGLAGFLTAEERTVVAMSRSKSRQQNQNAIGWKLENMWPLAWILGFEFEPTLDALQIPGDVTGAMMRTFLNLLDTDLDKLVQSARLRPILEVRQLEDRFYCAHNAVRGAQLGRNTVPDDFDPIEHGGVVHERRHALTWSLSPGITWDETDLST